MYTSSFHSPLGYMRAGSNDTGLFRLDWQQKPFLRADRENDISRETVKQIKCYLSSQLADFTVPLDLSSYSPALQLLTVGQHVYKFISLSTWLHACLFK